LLEQHCSHHTAVTNVLLEALFKLFPIAKMVNMVNVPCPLWDLLVAIITMSVSRGAFSCETWKGLPEAMLSCPELVSKLKMIHSPDLTAIQEKSAQKTIKILTQR
jgi:hypothetical protein